MKNKIDNNKKKKILIIVPLVAVLLAGLVFMIFFFKGRANPAHTDPDQTQTESETQTTLTPAETTTEFLKNFAHTEAENEIGNPANYTETTKTYAIKVFYPKTGAQAVDRAVEERVQECAKDFKDKASSSSSEKPALLKGDYKVFTASKELEGDKVDYYSLVFELDSRTDDGDDFKKEVRTLVLDAESGKILTSEDFFRPNFKKRAHNLILSYYSSQENTKDLAREENFVKALADTEGIYDKFALDGKNIRFYFNPGLLLPADMGVGNASVRVSDFGGLLKPRLAGFGIADGAKIVALTFDDGPNPRSTKAILDHLKANSAHATFFTLGRNARQYGETVKLISDSGSEVGCHSEGHKNLTKISNNDALLSEAFGHVSFIKERTGQHFVPFRPPYGAVNDHVIKVLNVPFFMWSIDPRDWAEKPKSDSEKAKSVEKITEGVLNNVKDGDIILLHDIYDLTAAAAAKILPALKERGYEVVSVSELFDARGIELQGGVRYRNAPPKN